MNLIFQIIDWYIPKYKDKYYRNEFSHNYDIIIFSNNYDNKLQY